MLGDVIRARPSLSRPRPLVGSRAFHIPQAYLLGELAHGSGLLLSTGIFDQLGVGPAFLGSADGHFLQIKDGESDPREETDGGTPLEPSI